MLATLLFGSPTHCYHTVSSTYPNKLPMEHTSQWVYTTEVPHTRTLQPPKILRTVAIRLLFSFLQISPGKPLFHNSIMLFCLFYKILPSLFASLVSALKSQIMWPLDCSLPPKSASESVPKAAITCQIISSLLLVISISRVHKFKCAKLSVTPWQVI